MAHGGKREGAGRKPGLASVLAEQTRGYIAQHLHDNIDPIVAKAVEQAISGDKGARDWLTEHGIGKAMQPVDHTTKGEKLPTPILGLTPNE